MDYIKEYSYGSKDGKPIYIIDTNILFSMCQLYYKGVCERKEITDELKQFILKARKHDVCNKFAIIINTNPTARSIIPFIFIVDIISDNTLLISVDTPSFNIVIVCTFILIFTNAIVPNKNAAAVVIATPEVVNAL